jgi:FkbM family methyltransferase
MNITFFPVFDSSDQFTDQYYRAIWYLRPYLANIDRIDFFLKNGCSGPDSIPDYMDGEILSFEADFSDKIRITPVVDVDAQNICNDADIILLWKSDPKSIKGIPPALRKIAARVVRIDHNYEQYAASFYLKISEKIANDDQAIISKSKRRFSDLASKFNNKPCYIFGTGPSLSFADDHDFSDGVSIACNSMVGNIKLLDRIQPSLLVVGDPIFHAGCSSYAGRFREHLCEALDRYIVQLIVPMRDYRIYRSNLPKRYSKSLIGIPFINKKRPNFDLLSRFHVRTTSNILTLFLIPIATTFCDEIRILGCDGRLIKKNEYFWSHHKPSQFYDKMSAAKEAHPSFFAIDYNDYYLEHSETLKKYLDAAERIGKEFINLTPSHIPALQALSFQTIQARRNNRKISIIMPALNAEKYIEEAIRSVRSQSFQDWELIVVDDGSSDSTLEIVYGLAKMDHRIRLIKNLGKGVSAARNTGIYYARGKYLAFLDSDDYYYPDSLRARVLALDENPGIKVVHGITDLVAEDGTLLEWQLGLRRKINFNDMYGNPLHINSTMIHRSILQSVSFDESLGNGEDWLFMACIMRSGYESKFVPGAHAAYRVHYGSTVLSDFDIHERTVEKVIDWVYQDLSDDEDQSIVIRKGLSSPPKTIVLQKRRIAHLVNCILAQDVDKAKTEVSKINKKIDDSFSKDELNRLVVNSATRYFIKPKNIAADISQEMKDQIEKVVEACDISSKLPRLFEALARNFRLRGERSMIPCMSFTVEQSVNMNEALFVWNILKKRPAGSVMIDVGAHHGSSLSVFARNGWKVYGIEPDSKNRSQLIERFGDFDNICIFDFAVSDRNLENIDFYSSNVSTGISGLVCFHPSHKKTGVVSTITLDKFCDSESIDNIEFLKIDVEGYEKFVLDGLDFTKRRPEVIVAEFEDSKTKPLGFTVYTLADFLMQKGYSLLISEWHPIVEYGRRHSWYCLKKYPCSINPLGWGNIIAFKTMPSMKQVQNALKRAIDGPLELKERYIENIGFTKKSNRIPNDKKVQKPFKIKKRQLIANKFIEYYEYFKLIIKHKYPPLARISMFILWSLKTIKLRMPGISALTFLLITGFLAAAIFIGDYRWFFALLGSGLSLVFCGVLAVGYAQYLYNGLKDRQRNELQNHVRTTINALQTQFENRSEEQIQQVRQELNQVVEEFKQQTKEELKFLHVQLEKMSTSGDETSNLNIEIYQNFNRFIRFEHIQKILEYWCPTLALDNMNQIALGYLAHRICENEKLCAGRLATSLQDALLRVLVAQSIKGRTLEVLEIGSLFGIGLIIIYDNCRGHFDRIHITAIDPLEGYYKKNTVDVGIKVPINRSIFEHNMRISDIPKKDVTLVQELSTARQALETVPKRSYHVLIIDGDHSYNGIKFDFDNYHKMVEPGGYIIFDDYNCKEWPDVTEFVNSEVKTKTDLKLIGHDWRTIVFQVNK